MSFTDLLTIAMPVYERKDFFQEALESALNQTVKCKVIVVDNCSSHNYFETICKDKGVDYYRNKENIGLFPNFNRCFELAETEYVMTLQDDDVMNPGYVESFLKAVDNYPDIDVYFTNFVRNYYQIGEKLPHRHTLPFGYMSKGNKVVEYGIRYKLGFPVIASAIKKEKFHGYYSAFFSSNDWLWLYSNADQLCFYGDDKVLYEFREHEQQNTKRNQSHIILSKPYIYGKILREKVNDSELKKVASKNELWSFIRLKAETNNKFLKRLIDQKSVYSDYFKLKQTNDRKIKFLFSLPWWMVNLLYRSLRKVGLAG